MQEDFLDLGSGQTVAQSNSNVRFEFFTSRLRGQYRDNQEGPVAATELRA